MAITAGQIVSPPNREQVATQERRQPQPPKFGVVSAVDGGTSTCDVLWEDGSFVQDIPVAQIDRIVQVAPDTTLRGRVCSVRLNSSATPEQSPMMTCLVVDVYQRSRNDAGVDGTALALCRSITGEFWVEVPIANVVPIPGR